MKKSLLIAVLAMGAAANAQPSKPAFDAQGRVTEAIVAIRPIAYNSDTADWPAIETRARSLAANAKDAIDLMPAYAAIVFGLKDGHSTIRPTKEQQEGWIARYGQRRLLPDEPPRPRPQSAFSSREAVAGQVIALPSGRQLFHLMVPAVEWAEGVASAPYGNELFKAVSTGSAKSCGFVVDLRGNAGGDVFPMVTGLSPLIGDGLT